MWQNISELHFLDAGTYAEEVLFPTEEELRGLHDRWLEAKKQSGDPRYNSLPPIHLHYSPRQIADPRRPWLRGEVHAFEAAAQRVGLSCRLWTYEAAGDPQSLETHFDIIRAFRLSDDEEVTGLGFFKEWCGSQPS
jgi:hypothetical protein